MKTKVAFVGAGRWALALAMNLVRRNADTWLWEVSEANRRRLLETKRHPDLPEQIAIPDEVRVSADLGEVLAAAKFVVLAVPSDALADAARQCAGLLPKTVEAIVTVSKGIDPASLRMFSSVVAGAIPGRPVVVIAGPGIPYDFALGDPTSLVAASADEKAALAVRDFFTGDNLRVYSSNDITGVELGAALKNVIALAVGIADGLGLGINAKAALLTRGLVEMTRLGIALNANPLTFSGLSGIGDLVVTAFSEHSRNHALGLLIGQGRTPADARSALNGVAEGATTCRSARALSLRHHIEMPITEELHRILEEDSTPEESLKRLLRRTPKKEAI